MFVEMFVEKLFRIMATLHLSVLSSRLNSKGKYPVLVAVTHKRDVRYIATGYVIDELFQFDKGLIVCRKDEKLMNQRLKYTLSEYQNKLDSIPELRIYNCSQLKEMLEGKIHLDKIPTIKEYMEARIARLKKEGRESYASMNEYTLNKILSILGDITLQSLNPTTIDKFIRGMSNLKNATKQMRLTHLKALINEAIKDGIVKYEVHPFIYTKMPKSDVRIQDITVEEFIAIRDFKTIHKRLSIGRDVFLISFYLGGINLIDLLNIDFSGKSINYVRSKTSNKKQGIKNVSLNIPEEVKPILNKYMKRNGKLDFGYKFSYSNLQRYINRCIKTLGVTLGVKTDMCYYSARKTFSQFAFDIGIRTEIIEYCIGQSMKENRPIYNYARVMQKQADSAISKIIDYTNYPEKYELNVMVL